MPWEEARAGAVGSPRPGASPPAERDRRNRRAGTGGARNARGRAAGPSARLPGLSARRCASPPSEAGTVPQAAGHPRACPGEWVPADGNNLADSGRVDRELLRCANRLILRNDPSRKLALIQKRIDQQSRKCPFSQILKRKVKAMRREPNGRKAMRNLPRFRLPSRRPMKCPSFCAWAARCQLVRFCMCVDVLDRTRF